MTRILVIESELRARHALRNILVSAGYEVELADDQSVAQDADLVIADGPSQWLPPNARVLAVPSGGPAGEAAERFRAQGAQYFLPKPFGRDDLLTAVRMTLSMAPGSPASRA